MDEGWRSGSLSAEISARIMEQAFWSLDAPVGAGVQRRGADPLPAPSGGGGAAAAVAHRRRGASRIGTVMAEFRMPSLGADMEAGTLVEWLKQPGDAVAKGDVIAVVETQKGAIEVEIFVYGTVERLLIAPGTLVPVGTPLAQIRVEGEAQAATQETPPTPLAAPPVVPPQPTPPLSVTVARVAESGLRASPAARKLASERGIDLASISGTGPGGAIVLQDVERAAKAHPPAKVERVAAPEAATPRRGIDASEMRKAIAAAMSRSKREIPHYYLTHTIDFSPASAWLQQRNASRQPPERVLPAALLFKAVAVALKTNPEFNGAYTAEGFRPSAAIHVGAAIAIRGGGLVAPAIHDADARTLDETMAALRDLVARTRSGRLRSSELFDPTITVSSLGDRGVDGMFAVIYPPQVAIIGFGTPALRPWVVSTDIHARTLITATLAADHRVSDGHRGALLLLEIERLLQQPEAL